MNHRCGFHRVASPRRRLSMSSPRHFSDESQQSSDSPACCRPACCRCRCRRGAGGRRRRRSGRHTARSARWRRYRDQPCGAGSGKQAGWYHAALGAASAAPVDGKKCPAARQRLFVFLSRSQVVKHCASPFPTHPHPVLFAAAEHLSFASPPSRSCHSLACVRRLAWLSRFNFPPAVKEARATAPHPRPAPSTAAAGSRSSSIVHAYTLVVLEEQNAEADAARVAGNDLFREQKYHEARPCIKQSTL